MIAHDYHCPNCNNTFERMVKAEQKTIRCSFCRHKALRVFLSSSRKRLGNATSTVYYVNKAGKKLYPWTGDALPKDYTRLGYQRVEVPPHEIRRFERELNREMESERSRERGGEQSRFEAEQTRRHESLRQDMAQMDAFSRDVAREAMRAENETYSSRYDPQFRIGAYE